MTSPTPTAGVSSTSIFIVSLDNIESLQEQWAASVASVDIADDQRLPPQPALNSPRSLEACSRAGIDAKQDLAKCTLKQVLLDTLQKTAADGSIELPLQQRDPSSALTAERTRVLQLYPFSLRNVGTDEDKLRAYDKYQQREGRRVSTIRMLREIRQQLIAAEEFRLKKAHEAAKRTLADTTKGSPPKPARSKGQTTGSAASDKPSSSYNKNQRDGSTSPGGAHSDGADSDISLSTASTTTGRNRLTRKTVAKHTRERESKPVMNPGEAAKHKHRDPRDDSLASTPQEKPLPHGSITTFPNHSFTSYRSKSHRTEDHMSEPRGFVSTDGANSDGDDDGDDIFVHHSRLANEEDDQGVEFVHITSGPDVEAEERRTNAALTALDAARRHAKKKELERSAAVERERKQRLIEEEERAFIRERILKGRNLARKIQTPQPVEWQPAPSVRMGDSSRSTTTEVQDPVHVFSSKGEVKVYGSFDKENGGGMNTNSNSFAGVAGTSQTQFPQHRSPNASANNSPRGSQTEHPVPIVHIPSIAASSAAPSMPQTPHLESARPPPLNTATEGALPPAPDRVGSKTQSPLQTPRMDLPSVYPPDTARSDGSLLAPSLVGLLDAMNGTRTPSHNNNMGSRGRSGSETALDISASKRKEVLEAAMAFQRSRQPSTESTGAAAGASNYMPQPIPSPSREAFASGSPNAEFDFSNREARARAVESSRRTLRPEEYESSVAERMMREDRDRQRWEAVERGRKAQELLLSGRSTIFDRAEHGNTMFM